MRGSKEIQQVPTLKFWEFDPQKRVFVEHINTSFEPAPKFLKPHRLEYFALRWLIKGRVKIYLDHIPYEMIPGSIMVAHPGQISKIVYPQNELIEFKVIAFNKEMLTLMDLDSNTVNLITGIVSHVFFKMENEEIATTAKYFDLIQEESKNEYSEDRDKILASLIKAEILYFINLNSRKKNRVISNHKPLNIYRKFLEELEVNYCNRHYVADYVEILKISEKSINRACKYLAKTTAGKIIQSRIDYEAKRLLYYTNNSVKEVGYHLGFNDPVYFNKFFKKMNGFTPGNYRKNLLSSL